MGSVIIQSYKTKQEQEMPEETWEMMKEKGLSSRYKVLERIPDAKPGKNLEPMTNPKKEITKMAAGDQGKNATKKEK